MGLRIAELWATVCPYITQLQSLKIEEQIDDILNVPDTDSEGDRVTKPPWAMLFTSKTTTHTLTHLTLPAELQPWLIRLLQRHAPRLQELTVDSVCDDAEHGAVCEPVCSWTVLRIWLATFPTNALAWLPVPAQGRLSVDVTHDACPWRPKSPITCSVALPVTNKVSLQVLYCLHVLCLHKFLVP